MLQRSTQKLSVAEGIFAFNGSELYFSVFCIWNFYAAQATVEISYSHKSTYKSWAYCYSE